MVERARHRMLAEQGPKAGPVELVERARLIEVVGHGKRRALQVAGILVHIGLGDRQRGIDDHARPDLEPAVETDVERDGGDDGDQNRRNGRHQREHGDDAHVQPRGRLAASARLVETMDLAPDQRDQDSSDEERVDADQAQRDGKCRARSASGRAGSRKEMAAVSSAPRMVRMPGMASSRRVSPWSATEAAPSAIAGVWIVIRAPEVNRQHLCNAMWRLCNNRRCGCNFRDGSGGARSPVEH
jgi:hypothetical protein